MTNIDIETIKERTVNLTAVLLNQGGDVIGTTKESHRIKGNAALAQKLMLPENPLAGEYMVTYSMLTSLLDDELWDVLI